MASDPNVPIRQNNSAELAGLLLPLTLALIVAYVLVRAWVYAAIPIASGEEWLRRDLVMNLPRGIALALGLLLARFFGSLGGEFRSVGPWRVVVAGLAALIAWVWFFSGSDGVRLAGPLICGGVLGSFVVGFWEEVVFRGALLGSMAKWPRGVGVIASSAIFAVFHVQAQSPPTWIPIFFTGVIYANMRLAGGTLLGLSLLHSVTDALYFAFAPDNPRPFSHEWMVFTGVLFGCGVGSFALWVRKGKRIVGRDEHA